MSSGFVIDKAREHGKHLPSDQVWRQNVPASWISTVNSIDMEAYWSEAGISFGGMNYYLLPMPTGGNAWSERFNPDSNCFQAWIGIYTVSDSNGAIYGMQNGELDENAIMKLGVADRTRWLMEFGRILSPIRQS